MLPPARLQLQMFLSLLAHRFDSNFRHPIFASYTFCGWKCPIYLFLRDSLQTDHRILSFAGVLQNGKVFLLCFFAYLHYSSSFLSVTCSFFSILHRSERNLEGGSLWSEYLAVLILFQKDSSAKTYDAHQPWYISPFIIYFFLHFVLILLHIIWIFILLCGWMATMII